MTDQPSGQDGVRSPPPADPAQPRVRRPIMHLKKPTAEQSRAASPQEGSSS